MVLVPSTVPGALALSREAPGGTAGAWFFPLPSPFGDRGRHESQFCLQRYSCCRTSRPAQFSQGLRGARHRPRLIPSAP